MSLRGEAGWKSTFQKAFGKERWPGLHKALKGAVSHVALVNPFVSDDLHAKICEERGLRPHSSIPLVCELVGEGGLAEGAGDEDGEGLVAPQDLGVGAASARAGAEGNEEEEAAAQSAPAERAAPLLLGSKDGWLEALMPCYFLDGGSAVAALALGVEPGMKVLDLCAAPGGKALVLASLLFGSRQGAAAEEAPAKGSILVCNEPSQPRARRLQKVLSSFLPAELLAPGGGVHVTMVEAIGDWTGGPPVPIRRLGPFDRVLVDAPCSSDRHLVKQGKVALSHWASGAVKANAERQLEILQCAATLVKPGGKILYCTCALAEQENDGVIAKFLKKASRDWEVELPSPGEDGKGCSIAEALPAIAEPTGSGALMLPDRSSYGPMYVASLRKV